MCKVRNNSSHEDELHLELYFKQSTIGVFTMMLDHPIVWNETVDKDTVLNYVFSHQHITRFNQVMLSQYQATEAEILKWTPADFFRHNVKQGRDIWRKLFDQGHLITETEEMRADGTTIWIEGEYNCLYDDKGRITGHVGVQHDITNRKQAEQWSQYLSTVMDQISDSIVVTDRDSKITLINKATERMFGYRQEELVGLAPTIFRNDPVPDGVQSNVYAAVSTRGSHNDELICRRKDGSVFTCEIKITRVNNEQGQPIAYVGIQRDVTERNRLERAYKESLERFNQLARQARTYTWEVDAKGLYTYVSETVKDVIGYSVDEVAGKMQFFDPFVKQEQEQIKQKAFGYFADKKPFVDFRNPVVSKTGKIIYLSTNALPIIDENGVLLGYRGSDCDITEKVAMENAMSTEKELYKTTLMSVGDGVISADSKCQIKMMNPVAEQLTGWSLTEADGKPLEEIVRLIDEQNLEPCDSPAQTVLMTGNELRSINHTILVNRSGEAVPIEVSAAPIIDGSRQTTGVVLVFRDMTDKREKQHLNRIAYYCEVLAEALGSSTAEIEVCKMAGSLHDFKKMTFLQGIRKKGDSESDSLNMNSPSANNKVAEAILYQHERWNGSGHPEGLAGDAIPLMARILAVADCYEVMTSDHTIQNRQNIAEAIAVLEKNKGILFDPHVVQVFIDQVLQGDSLERHA
ncbi:MAG: PAS domain S-box protein [Bacillota bacterium]|nr:PAS domain S-box protein [Bacillota bacterium]